MKYVTLVAVGFAATTSGPMAAATKPTLSYVLPKTVIVAEVRQTLTACPDEAGALPEIETAWSILPAPLADPDMKYQLDASAGFLAKRNATLLLRADGTPETLNASSTGQGAVVLASVLKLVTKVASLAAVQGGEVVPAVVPSPPASPAYWRCSKASTTILQKIAKAGHDAAALEDKVLLGTATTAQTQLLDRLRRKRAGLRDALTLGGSVVFEPAGSLPVPTPRSNKPLLTGQGFIPALAYDNWFDAGTSKDFLRLQLEGVLGFGVDILAPANIAQLQRPAQTPPSGTVHRALFYRHPLPAAVIGAPCVRPKLKPEMPCEIATTSDASSDPVSTVFAQWSKVHFLPVGNAGLFGSREAKAKFDPFGTPLELTYGSDSGAAGIASTIDAGTEAVGTLNDAELNQLERAIKLEEVRQKLAKLRAEPSE